MLCLPGLCKPRKDSRTVSLGPHPRDSSDRVSNLASFGDTKHSNLRVLHATPSKTGVFGRLPAELIVTVVEFHLDHWAISPDPFFATYDQQAEVMPRRDWAAQSRILALSHVNRHWHEALISLIYWRPVLTSARALRNFAALLQATPDLAKHVKGLILFDRTGDEDEQAEDSFFNTTYCTGGAIREQTQDALISLVACREPGTLNVIFITKSNQQMDVSERGGSLLRWGPRSMDHFHSLDLARRAACTALASLRSLTLHGFASHLLYTPSSAWFDTTSMAFRSLEQLALDSLRLGQIHWPNMPLLTTLTVKNCYIRGHALPSPGLAPRLRSLTWVNHQPFGTDFNTEGGFLTTVLWYSQSLSSLTIDFDDCQKLMKRADFGTAFPALRELASHDHRRNQGSIEAQHFPIRYPASLGILRMQTSWREVFVIFTTEHAQKALAPDVLAQFARTKKELHIMGDDAFWDRVPTWCLDEARVVCRRENVTYTNSVEQLLARDRQRGAKLSSFADYVEKQDSPKGMLVWEI